MERARLVKVKSSLEAVKMNERIDGFHNKLIARKGDPNSDSENHKQTLKMKISTWMAFYASLETPEYRAKLRDVCISIARNINNENIVVKEHGTFLPKFDESAPYHYFLTLVTNVEATHSENFSVTFHEIIDYTIGEIVDSLYLCGDIELSWIVTEYMLAAQVPKMTIICDHCLDSKLIYDLPFDIDLTVAETHPIHNSRITILKYKNDKIRIIVSSINLRVVEWECSTQGLWISPFLPILPDTADLGDGESITNFKRDFIDYLSEYKQPEVFGWKALVQKADCSNINVFFIASVPGNHTNSHFNKWGHQKLNKVLSNHITIPSDSQNWSIIAQSVSIGNYDKDYETWLKSNIVRAMAKEKNKRVLDFPDIKIIYPSENNIKKSLSDISDVYFQYRKECRSKQQWLNKYLFQWRSEWISRTSALPFIRCYTRISPDATKIQWFLLTTCDLTKSSWGEILNIQTMKIDNYEAGVLFIPELIIKQKSFPIKESDSPEVPVFLIPYDIPLIQYEPNDEPYVTRNLNCEEHLQDTKKNVDKYQLNEDDVTV